MGPSGAADKPEGVGAGRSGRGPADGEPARLVSSGLLREAARASDSYGLLLVLILVDYVLLSVGWNGGWATITKALFVGLTALLGFHTSHVRGRLLLAVRIAVGVALVAACLYAIASATHHQSTLWQGIVGLILAMLILTTPIAVVSRIVRHDRVTAETLLGAICVYILLGLVFAYVDFSVFLVSKSFFAQSSPAGGFNSPDFVYFSYITMTTVGYGDLSPASGFPRTLAVMEALTGQIFLVVMVSRLVAMYTPRPARARRVALEQAGGRGSAGAGAGGEVPDDEAGSNADAPADDDYPLRHDDGGSATPPRPQAGS